MGAKRYEPGSVLKILTMAAVLWTRRIMHPLDHVHGYRFDHGTWTASTITTGTIPVGAGQDMVGCMQHPINICMVWVAHRRGTDTFYTYLKPSG